MQTIRPNAARLQGSRMNLLKPYRVEALRGAVVRPAAIADDSYDRVERTRAIGPGG